jgi:hypothetical protein
VEKSAANFAAEAKQPGATTYAGCTADYRHYAVAGTTATLPLTLDIKVNMPGAAPVVPVVDIATFVEQGGAWKLDGLAPAPPAK